MTERPMGLSEKFEIVNDLPRYATDLRIVGNAYKNDLDDHYVLRLRVFPFIKYFLRAKDSARENFLIFSGLDDREDEVRLFNVIGKGEHISDEYIKLNFYDLNLICYLRLDPKDYNYTHQAAA